MRLFEALSRWPRAVLATILLFALGGALLSSRLDLHTAFSELLPDDDPGVRALERTQARMGDLSLLLVGIKSPDPAANVRYAEALTTALRALPPTVCEIATYHVRDLADFFRTNRWLYASEADIDAIHDRVRREIGRRKNPLFVSLDDDAEGDAALERKLTRDPLGARFAGGLFQHAGSDTLWVAALPPGGLMVENPGKAILAATQAFIAQNPPSRFHPQMDLQPAGPLMSTIRNRAALERDLMGVGALCLILIPASIALYFRRARAVAFVAAPALLAVVLSYAVAYLAFGYLTTVTSFLVSFVMGNGTNYAVVLLARYETQRAEGVSARAAALEAVATTWRPTGVAALASALSYFSLLVTGFRGFSQFGLIGGAGCLLAWLMTFTLMPALLVTFDKKASRRTRATSSVAFQRLATLIERSPRIVLWPALVLTLIVSAGAARFGRDAFEYDFRKLSARGIVDARAEAFDVDKEALFGRWPQPSIIVADRLEDVPALEAAIRRADAAAPGADVIGEILTLSDLLPGAPEVQRRKLEALAKVRGLLADPALQHLEGKDRRDLDRLRPPESLHVLTAADLPPLARRPFTEADGTVGRVLLYYPPEKGLSIWDGRALLRIAGVVQRLTLPDGRQVETSGNAVIFAAMIRSVLRDGPLATIASLTAVFVLVLLRVRPLRAALTVVGALLLGVAWMIGIAGWLGMKITFLNFIALPFIFGVGVEYAIHVVSEWREHRDVRRTVLSAGGPIALCSWSAIVGYSSLLIARNGALQGLGGLAALGEVACLAAAVVVTPAAIAWTMGRRAERRRRALP